MKQNNYSSSHRGAGEIPLCLVTLRKSELPIELPLLSLCGAAPTPRKKPSNPTSGVFGLDPILLPRNYSLR